MNRDQDDELATLRAAHRAAVEALDERPDPRVRDAVLAAATKAAGARQRTRWTGPFRAGHWPRSMAAVLVVAVLTGLVATQVLRHEPERLTNADEPTASSTPAPTGDAPKAAATPPAAPAAPVTSSATRSAPASAGVRRARANPSPPPSDSNEQRGRAEGAARALPASAAQPAAPAAAPASIATNDAAPREADADRSRDAVRKPEAANPRRANFATAATVETPEAWAERIVRLREAHLDEEADRELKALRARYPDFALPPAALKAASTP